MEELNSADRQWQLDARNEELDRCNKMLEKTTNRAQGSFRLQNPLLSALGVPCNKFRIAVE